MLRLAFLMLLAGVLHAQTQAVPSQLRGSPAAPGSAGSLFLVVASGQMVQVQLGPGFSLANSSEGAPMLVFQALVQAAHVPNEVPKPGADANSFSLAHVPVAGSEQIYRNGLRQKVGSDYTITGQQLVFLSVCGPPTARVSCISAGDNFLVDYLYVPVPGSANSTP